MLIRCCSIPILACLFFTTDLSSQDQKDEEKQKDDAPVVARLIVKQETYVLPPDRHGDAFRKRILKEEDCENLPPAPEVNLILELKNVSKEDVNIWPRGAISYPTISVEGMGVVKPENLQSFAGQGSATSAQPTIKPGETYRIKIKSLNPQGGTPLVYWCEPGQYSIQASYTVYTGLPSFPFPDKAKKPTAKPKKYQVTTPKVKIKVVLKKPKSQ